MRGFMSQRKSSSCAVPHLQKKTVNDNRIGGKHYRLRFAVSDYPKRRHSVCEETYLVKIFFGKMFVFDITIQAFPDKSFDINASLRASASQIPADNRFAYLLNFSFAVIYTHLLFPSDTDRD
jgi:hypothetical protein